MDASTVEEGLKAKRAVEKAKRTYEEYVGKAHALVRHHNWPLKFLPAISEPWARITAPFAVTGSSDLLGGRKLLVDGKCIGTFPAPSSSCTPSSAAKNPHKKKKATTRSCSSLLRKLSEIACPSKFGRGQASVYDPQVRLCREIAGSRIELDPPIDDHTRGLMVKELLTQLVPGSTPCNWNIRTELHKLMLYEQGGHFEQHVDSLHGPNHVASLVIVSDVEHEGGNLVVSFMNSSKVVLDCSSSAGDRRGRWIAFYTDCPHMVEPVTKGARVLLQYDVYVEGAEPSRSLLYLDHPNNPFEERPYSYEWSQRQEEDEEVEQEMWLKEVSMSREDQRGQCAAAPRITLQLQALHEGLRGVLLHGPKADPDSSHEDGDSDSSTSSESKWAKVGLLLHHRYRATQLQQRGRNDQGAEEAHEVPYFLKGGDAIGYKSLLQEFEVEVLPLLIDIEVLYNNDPMEINMRAAPLVSNWDDDVKTTIPILLPGDGNLRSSVSELYHLYEEETGNEPQYGDDTYVGGCLLISDRCNF